MTILLLFLGLSRVEAMKRKIIKRKEISLLLANIFQVRFFFFNQNIIAPNCASL